MNHQVNRRHWLHHFGMGLGGIAAMQLIGRDMALASPNPASPNPANPNPANPQGIPSRGVINPTHHAPKAKRVIYLFQAGGPSQLETWDYKPLLNEQQGQAAARFGATRSAAHRDVRQPGDPAPRRIDLSVSISTAKAAAWVSELMPHMASKSIGSPSSSRCTPKRSITIRPSPSCRRVTRCAGRPSIGAWLELRAGQRQRQPAVVRRVDHQGQRRTSRSIRGCGVPVSCPLASSGCAISLRAKSRCLYLDNPPGISSDSRRKMLDRLRQLALTGARSIGDPELATRIAQYEMAYRMQSSVPEVDRSVATNRSTSWTCTAPTPNSQAHSPRTACLLVGLASAA